MPSLRGARKHLPQVLMLGVFILCAATIGVWVWRKQQWFESQMAAMEPRHARLLGLELSSDALAQRLGAARATLTRNAYPSEQDAAQAGNAAQQKIRMLFTDSKLDVISIQVLPAKELPYFDRIGIVVRLEGDLVSLYNAMLVLEDQSPTVWVDSVSVQAVGLVKPKASQRLAAQFDLTVLRSRS